MDVVPKKCCLKYEPPTLILFYELPFSGKIHRRSIPIKGQELKDGKTEKVLQKLSETHHSKYLQQFKREQLLRLLKILSEKQMGIKINLNGEDSNDEKKPDNSNSLDLEIESSDLNKLEDRELNKVKKHMNTSFEEHQVKLGDQKWQYDVEVDFENPNAEEKIESAGWDEESDMEF